MNTNSCGEAEGAETRGEFYKTNEVWAAGHLPVYG